MIYKAENERKQNSIEKIRNLLLSLELEKTYAEGMIAKYKAIISKGVSNGKHKKESEARYLNTKTKLMLMQDYYNQINDTYLNVSNSLYQITDLYIGRYRKVFIDRFISRRSYKDISERTGYSIDAISKIVSKIKKDLQGYNIIVETDEEAIAKQEKEEEKN